MRFQLFTGAKTKKEKVVSVQIVGFFYAAAHTLHVQIFKLLLHTGHLYHIIRFIKYSGQTRLKGGPPRTVEVS